MIRSDCDTAMIWISKSLTFNHCKQNKLVFTLEIVLSIQTTAAENRNYIGMVRIVYMHARNGYRLTYTYWCKVAPLAIPLAGSDGVSLHLKSIVAAVVCYRSNTNNLNFILIRSDRDTAMNRITKAFTFNHCNQNKFMFTCRDSNWCNYRLH